MGEVVVDSEVVSVDEVTEEVAEEASEVEEEVVVTEMITTGIVTEITETRVEETLGTNTVEVGVGLTSTTCLPAQVGVHLQARHGARNSSSSSKNSIPRNNRQPRATPRSSPRPTEPPLPPPTLRKLLPTAQPALPPTPHNNSMELQERVLFLPNLQPRQCNRSTELLSRQRRGTHRNSSSTTLKLRLRTGKDLPEWQPTLTANHLFLPSRAKLPPHRALCSLSPR